MFPYDLIGALLNFCGCEEVFRVLFRHVGFLHHGRGKLTRGSVYHAFLLELFLPFYRKVAVLKNEQANGNTTLEVQILRTNRIQLTDVINSTSAELSKELLGAKILKVRDKERPKMQHVVPGETVSFLDDDALCAEHRALDGRAETDWAGSNDENLNKEKKHISLI